MDADVYGPSIPLSHRCLGSPAGEKHDGRERIVPLEAHGLKLMSMGFFVTDELTGDLARARWSTA